jgi:hypothetical protein
MEINKQMKTALTITAGIATTLSTAHARLGENINEYLTRYGEPRSIELNEENTGVAIYRKNDLVIKIHFTKGRSDLINYSPGEVARIDFETAKYLVEINGRDKEWEQLTDTKYFLRDIQDEQAQKIRELYVDPILWKTKDGILVASYSDSTRTLEIKAYYEQDKIRQGL